MICLHTLRFSPASQKNVTNTTCFCSVAGIFTAPVNGLYYFSFSTYGYNTHVMGAILMKNGAHQISTYDNLSVDGSDSCSNAVVLQLAAGDKVYMELWENSRVFDNLNGHTTFSGFLIFPVQMIRHHAFALWLYPEETLMQQQ